MDILLGILLYLGIGHIWLKSMLFIEVWSIDYAKEEADEWDMTMKITTILFWPILLLITLKGFVENYYR